MTGLIWRNDRTATGIVLLALGVALAGCPEDGGESDAAIVEAVELPQMSEGTLQALGPHVFVAETTVTPAAGSTRKGRTDREELRWQDLQHYHFTHIRNGEPLSDVVREGELKLQRKGNGKPLWVPPEAGPDILRDTMTPGNRMLGDIEPHSLLVEQPAEGTDEPARFTLSLLPELVAADDETRAAIEQRFADAGATLLPVAVEGEVTVDALGNRTAMRLVYTYRVRDGAAWDPAVIVKSHEESRTTATAGVALDIAPEIAVKLAEARAAAEEQTDPPR